MGGDTAVPGVPGSKARSSRPCSASTRSAWLSTAGLMNAEKSVISFWYSKWDRTRSLAVPTVVGEYDTGNRRVPGVGFVSVNRRSPVASRPAHIMAMSPAWTPLHA